MTMDEKYCRVYEGMEELIGKRVHNKVFAALGYTSNLDFLCDFQVERLNQLLAEYMPYADLSKLQPANQIDSMDELLGTMVYYCMNGIGGEADVENIKLVEESFPFEYGMGGTGVQAAMALAELECPSVVHLTDDSKEVCDILRSPYIYTVSKDGRLVHTEEIAQTQEQEIHFIIQFKKGDVICLGEQKVEIPVSNRLILTKITVNEYVPFSEPYFRWVEAHARQVSSNVLSSFNALLDSMVLTERLDCVKEHIRKYKANNPDGIVFFEDAHYHDYTIRKLCLETIYQWVDIVSLNEEELKYTLDMYGFKVDIENIISCIEGAKYIREKFGVEKGVIIHTKDYSMYVGVNLNKDIESGLMMGNLLATAKANFGWYGSMDQVKQILELELSPKGSKNYRIVSESKYVNEAILVPSKYIDRPKYTIGLGDSFVGGVQLCF